MQYVRLVLFLLAIALVASFLRLPGLEFLASDAAKWVIVIGIIVAVARLVGLAKSSE